jgi:uncharacterized protein
MIRTVIFSVALIIAAAVLGLQVKQVGRGTQSISVKGLAEKAVTADAAEWTVGLQVQGATLAEALAKLRRERPALDEFLAKAGITKEEIRDAVEDTEPNYEQVEGKNGMTRSVQVGYIARQDLVVRTKNLPVVVDASRSIVQFEADGHPVRYFTPNYLVTNLEEVKMSLIGAATQNAKVRATEFAKNGDVKVGAMRSASQGSFYILAAGGDNDTSDYGGVYDKSTVEKIARVVVTVDYAID